MSGLVSVFDHLSEFCRKEHVELLKGLNNKTAWSKEADLGYGNQVVSATHDDRTILELLQNARDAIVEGGGDGRVSVIVGPESLMVANTGSPFRLDDEDVFSAVTSLGRSAKAQDRGSVGEKGVGLKSILQSSERFSIYSQVDGEHLSAHFSRAHTAQMVLGSYGDILDEPSFTAHLEEGTNDALVDACRSLADDVGAGAYPEYLDVDRIHTRLLEERQQPPSPSSILSDLPRLSLFRYPFPSAASTDDSPLRSNLVGASDSAHSSANPIGNDLRSWLDTTGNSFTTLVELDYMDEEWRTLLSRVNDILTDADTEALSTFRDNRSSTTTDRAESIEQRQNALWEECDDISPETLILLGHIEQLDLVRITRDEGGTLRMDDYRKVTVESGDVTMLPDAPALSRRLFTYREYESLEDDSVTHAREFRRYTRTNVGFADGDGQTEPHDDIHLLIEKPPTSTEWRPTSKPLYLYYPINEAETPFPFVIHAPFRVGFDRQSLAEDDQNQRILEELSALVANAATDLAMSESSDTESAGSFAEWMPWLMTPVAPVNPDNESSPTTDAVERTFDRLRDEPIVPTDDDEPQRPTETLIDPERLLAFEALRERAPDPPLPAASAVESGRAWRSDVVGEPEEFREWTANVGLTAILDRPRDGENGRGSIDLLCEHWEASDVPAAEWAIGVDDAEHAEQYFGAVHGILRNASEGDELDLNDGTDAKEAAKKLGTEKVPLLPAEAHREDGGGSEAPSVTHLVRARSRSTTNDGGGASRSERIVFRRAADSGDVNRSRIGNLPTPPDELPVFVMPFRTNWSGALEGYNRDWGTRSLDSPTAFYRRIAAEAGGFSGKPRADAGVVRYLADLYLTVTESRVVESLRPKPHHHHRYEDVEETLRGAKTYTAPTDYDDYLERRYTQRVRLPVVADGSDTDESTSGTEPLVSSRKTIRPAERLTFGAEWAAEFANAADTLETIGPDHDPFDGDESREETRADAFRRWSTAIKLADDARCDGSHEVAPPSHDYWDDVFGDVDAGDPLDRVHRLDTLIHLGVQVGPRIKWRWSLPQQAERNRTVGTLTASEAEALSRGEVPDSGTFSPSPTLLEDYRDVVWRSDNDPAFSAGHSGKCRKKWLDPNIDEWAGRRDGVLIPTWWFFPDLQEAGTEASRRYRDAALLMWPELDDAIVETAWVCSSQPHQFKSPKDTIPSLGVVQLARRELWPAEGTPEDDSGDDRFVVRDSECYQARRLLLDESDVIRGAAQYLPRVDVDALEDSLATATDGDDPCVVDVASALQSLGIDRLGALTPPMAAERLDWFLSQFAVGDPKNGGRTVEARTSWATRSMSVPVNGLMRRLVADEELSRQLEEREPKRRWLRRDLRNLGTLIPITEGDTSKTLRIGGDSPLEVEPNTVVFTETLSKFARARLVNDRQRFVERPADPAEIAYVLGDGDGAGDFGISLRSDPPTPRAVRNAETELDGQRLERLRSRLHERREFLLAACLENTAGIDLVDANRELISVFENPIGVVRRDSAGSRRNSAKWEASDDDGSPRIALFRDSLDRFQDESEVESEEIPAYLVADGLVQVIGQYDLRDTFEAILFKDASALENEYQSTLRDVRRDIAELRTRRLERTHEALSALATTLEDGVTLSPPESFEVDARTTLDTLRAADDDQGMENIGTTGGRAVEAAITDNPLLCSWVDELTDDCGLSRENAAVCLLAAATENHRKQLRFVVWLDRACVLDADALVDANERWRSLDVWPDGGMSSSIEAYVEAAERIQWFFGYLTEHEDEGQDGIHQAIRKALSVNQFPGPLTVGEEFVPTSGDLASDLRDRHLVEFPYVDREPPAVEALTEAITSWVSNEREDLQKSDVVYRDQEVDELFDQLADAAGAIERPVDIVEKAFENFRHRTDGRAAGSESTRTGRTADWIVGSDDSLRDISQQFAEASAGSTTAGGSPDIGSSGGGYDHENAQIDVRGRDGELICLERAWGRFRNTPHKVRSDILQEVRRWRSYDRWRLDSMTDVAASASDAALGVVVDDDLVELLQRKDLDGGRKERAAFHALFDTSAERGPGFDLIDPFAAMSDDQPLLEWSADWMRRVEAKAVASNRLRKGRIKLTGNELRMALREGPDGEGVDTRRYLVRLVGFPTEWRDEEIRGGDVRLLDIENVAEFAGFDPAATPILEKLRGGSFYVTFSTGE